MSATDNGRIDEIISALQFLGKEKLISYSEEIKWLTELKQRLANSEWRNVKYNLPTENGEYLIFNPDKECFYNGIEKVKYFVNPEHGFNKGWQYVYHEFITHWMPLPEEPKNK